MPKLPATDRFQKLVDDISRLYADARQAQVRFAWETGKRIVEEEQNGEMRAKYGAGLISELSKVLSQKYGPGFSPRTLQKMRRFYTHRSIAPAPTELGWTDYVELMPLKDKKKRKHLVHRILKEGLKTRDIRKEVRRLRHLFRRTGKGAAPARPHSGKPLPPLKRPTGLKLNTFSRSPLRAKIKEGYVLIDCGFFVRWPVKKKELKGLDLGGMSYTYAATVDCVVDGDTLLVLIEVGFGIIVRDRLRLRGINCPEMSTPQGVRAKKYVEKLLPVDSTVVINSHKCKIDTYGRFVADVFFKEGVKEPSGLLKDAVYLNQHLLDSGHALRMAE